MDVSDSLVALHGAHDSSNHGTERNGAIAGALREFLKKNFISELHRTTLGTDPSLGLSVFFLSLEAERTRERQAAAASQNEAEESDATEEEATRESTTRRGRPRGGTKVAARIGERLRRDTPSAPRQPHFALGVLPSCTESEDSFFDEDSRTFSRFSMWILWPR